MYASHVNVTLSFHFFLFVLLCIFSVTVENVSSIRFDNLHVYKQLHTCVYTHLNKYNLCLIVISCLHSTRLIHVCIIMYLCCIQLYYVSLHTVYTMNKSCNCLYYYDFVKCTLIQSCPLFPFFYLIVNVIQTLSKYCHKKDSRFINKNNKHLCRILPILIHICIYYLFGEYHNLFQLFVTMCNFL